MAANLSFNVRVFMENGDVLPELQYRQKHLEPAFQAIFEQWVKLNAQKFEQAVGQEMSGADVFGEEWAPVTEEYYAVKHGMGNVRVTKKLSRGGKASFGGPYPDWLMVRTGALRNAMTDPDALFNAIDDDKASFGTPNDPDLADIIAWQSGDKQKNRIIVFLSDPDVNAIRRIIQDYLSMGGNFEARRSLAGQSAKNMEIEVAGLDAEFAGAVNE